MKAGEFHSGSAETATRWVPTRPEPAGRDDRVWFDTNASQREEMTGVSRIRRLAIGPAFQYMTTIVILDSSHAQDPIEGRQGEFVGRG